MTSVVVIATASVAVQPGPENPAKKAPPLHPEALVLNVTAIQIIDNVNAIGPKIVENRHKVILR